MHNGRKSDMCEVNKVKCPPSCWSKLSLKRPCNNKCGKSVGVPTKKVRILQNVVVKPARFAGQVRQNTPPNSTRTDTKTTAVECLSGQSQPFLRNVLENNDVFYANGLLHLRGNCLTPDEAATGASVEIPADDFNVSKLKDRCSTPLDQLTNLTQYLGHCNSTQFNSLFNDSDDVPVRPSALSRLRHITLNCGVDKQKADCSTITQVTDAPPLRTDDTVITINSTVITINSTAATSDSLETDNGFDLRQDGQDWGQESGERDEVNDNVDQQAYRSSSPNLLDDEEEVNVSEIERRVVKEDQQGHSDPSGDLFFDDEYISASFDEDYIPPSGCEEKVDEDAANITSSTSAEPGDVESQNTLFDPADDDICVRASLEAELVSLRRQIDDIDDRLVRFQNRRRSRTMASRGGDVEAGQGVLRFGKVLNALNRDRERLFAEDMHLQAQLRSLQC